MRVLKRQGPLWLFCGFLVLCLLPIFWHMVDETLTDVVVYMNAAHPCCPRWVEYLRKSGFHVRVVTTSDSDALRNRAKVPGALAACHTAFTVNGPRYVIEGHVPADVIRRLLDERPSIRGLSVAGMPVGAPGLEGSGAEALEVYAFTLDARTMVFQRYVGRTRAP